MFSSLHLTRAGFVSEKKSHALAKVTAFLCADIYRVKRWISTAFVYVLKAQMISEDDIKHIDHS